MENQTEEQDKNTPDSDAVVVEAAGFWLRFFAHLIDMSIVYLLVQLIQFGIGSLPLSLTAAVAALVVQVVLAIFIPYFFLIGFEASPLQATPGKIVMGLYVIGPDRGPPSFLKVLLRNIARILCALTLGLGYVMAGFTVGKQGLHDMLATTYVVRRNAVAPAQRLWGAIFSLFFLITVGILFPTEERRFSAASSSDRETRAPETVSIDSLEGTLPAAGSGFIPFPSSSPGYLQYDGGTTEFADVFVRLESVAASALGGSGPLAEQTQQVRFAFYESELSESDESNLRKASDFFTDSKRLIEKEAVAVVTLTYPSYLQICESSRITSAYIDFNVSQLPTQIGENRRQLRTPFEPTELFSDNKFYSHCTELAPGSSFELALQHTSRPVTDSSSLLLNVRLSDTIAERKADNLAVFKGGQDSFALYSSSTGVLTVGVFGERLQREDKKAIYKARSMTAARAPLIAVATYLIPYYSNKRFMQDQVQSWSLTLYRQPSGPLAFPGDSASITRTYTSELPSLLTGRVRTGERLVGKIEGSHAITRGKDRYPLRWTIPFNAQLILLD